MSTQNLANKSIVLVGMMGCGKSSVGRKLADAINMDFIDLDEEVERVSQQKIADIFAVFGEEEFRALETRVLRRVLREKPLVLATGGGAFLRKKNRQLIEKYGISVWLDADLETIWERVAGKTHRPLLQTADPKKTLGELLEKRKPVYELAGFHVKSLPQVPHEEMVLGICKTLGIDINSA